MLTIYKYGQYKYLALTSVRVNSRKATSLLWTTWGRKLLFQIGCNPLSFWSPIWGSSVLHTFPIPSHSVNSFTSTWGWRKVSLDGFTDETWRASIIAILMTCGWFSDSYKNTLNLYIICFLTFFKTYPEPPFCVNIALFILEYCPTVCMFRATSWTPAFQWGMGLKFPDKMLDPLG